MTISQATQPHVDPAADPHVVGVIEPPRGWPLPDFRELWGYRDLFYFLARRDVSVKYKQSAIGVGWAVLRPLIMAAVFTVFFGLLLKLPVDGLPRPAFYLTGMTLWLLFSMAVGRAAESTTTSADLISKVYFPRLLIPLAAIAAPLVDFAFGFVVLEAVLLLYGIGPEPDVFLLPLILVLSLGFAAGAGLWMSALAARWRDVNLVVPFVIQIAFWTSAVIYPLSVVPEHLRGLFTLNPIVGLTEGFRAAMLPVGLDPAFLIGPTVVSLLLLVTGLMYFTRAERTIADVI
jgi:lipopolysaccharide transport system permease protein